MEGKTVILSVLILSLVLAQVQVEAKSCCPSTSARNIYNTCRFTGASRDTCASLSGCKIQSSSTCVPPYNHETLENSGVHGMNAYCKLGCASSVCDPVTTLQTSGVNAGEVVNEAVENCIKACSEFCTKSSIGARAIA